MTSLATIQPRPGLAVFLGVALFATLPTTELHAQPRGGIVRARIVNGTTGGEGQAERAVLLNLSSGMEMVASAENVSSRFTLEGFELQAEQPYLLQVTHEGVNYNQRISFGRGYEAEATITVYDATRDWDGVKIKTARFLLRREHERLRIDKLYVVENETEPKTTLHDPEGSFRFHMPSDLVEMRAISATSSSGMPVPQAASPLPDGSGYFTRTAFKPGMTDIAISYDIDYSAEHYHIEEKAFHALDELMVLVSPADIGLEAEGWDNLGPEPDGRYVVLRKSNLLPGSPIELGLSGGSEHATDLVSSSSGGGGAPPEGHPSTQVIQFPDHTRAQKWIVVLLMGAALAYGLLTVLVPAPETTPAGKTPSTGLQQTLAALEHRHGEGKISTKSYRKKKRELQAQMERAAGREKH
jgi:hypothetical protein